MKVIPEELLIGRRAIDLFGNIELLEDFIWSERLGKWYLKLSVLMESMKLEVPPTTCWYLTTDNEYPRGEIKFYPSMENGLTVTFQHQANNSEDETIHGLWRLGAPCLEVNVQSLNLRYVAQEPRDAEYRIEWHLRRLLAWIDAAINDSLQRPGDAYELPQINSKRSGTIVYSEDRVNVYIWDDASQRAESFGLATMIKLQKVDGIEFIDEFFIKSSEIVHKNFWGSLLKSSATTSPEAIWILLKKVPVVKVWQIPMTYGELRQALFLQNINFLKILSQLSNKIRDGKSHAVLLGCPIPATVGGENDEYIWLAFQLPVLSRGDVKVHGFRKNSKGKGIYLDRLNVLNDKAELEWIKTGNWNQKVISSRGRLNMSFCRSRILIIGAGCIGASIAEILVRGGVNTLGIIDRDVFEKGNLSRHTLLMDDISKNKAVQLKNRLVRASPNISIIAYDEMLNMENMNPILNEYDIIIDCTGENDVLYDLAMQPSSAKKVFFSISISYAAKYLFIAICNGKVFRYDDFIETIKGYLAPSEEKIYLDNEVIKTESLGCWHPLFPARCDDIWLAASTSIQVINRYFESKDLSSFILIFRHLDDGYRVGYELLEKKNVH